MKIQFAEGLQRFNKIYREMDEFYHKVALECGVSDSAFWILYAICEGGDGCLQKDICEMFSVSKQTVHSAIHKLEKEGYLYLEAGKGKDKHIFLTEQGNRFIEEKIEPVITLENNSMSELGEDEAVQMLRTMERYLSFLQKNYSYTKED